MKSKRRVVSLIAVMCLYSFRSLLCSAQDLDVQDKFGRSLSDAEIVLVDWEGHLANPAIRLMIVPPIDAVLPGSASVRAFSSRLYFNNPSTIGASGPAKTLSMPSSNPQSLFVSIFPDRDTLDEMHQLRVVYTDAVNNRDTIFVPIHVIDQDTVRPLEFQITVDFSQDPSGYGFYDDPVKRAVAQQAADDWAYFFDDMGLYPVAAGDEWLWYWTGTDFATGYWSQTTYSFTGFLLNSYGHNTTSMISGGSANWTGFQHNASGELPLRRTGSYNAYPFGDYDNLGWYVSLADDDWYVTGNQTLNNDLYAIAMHEIGHAIGHNTAYPIFESAVQAGFFADPGLLAYLGHYPAVNAACHLVGEVDPASMKGGYGNDYYGWNPGEGMPLGRWQITKLALLSLKAVGYTLRPTTPFQSPELLSTVPPNGQVGSTYSHQLSAVGGIPFYRFSVQSGALPPGITLNSFSGTIDGIPTIAGAYNLTIQLDDYGNATAQLPLTITIEAPPCACDCHADPSGCDVFRDITDVVQTINVAFRNFAPILDPNAGCPYQTTDLNCSTTTDVVDVVKMIGVAFRNSNPVTEICNPCP